ncbi:MAG TPA: sigma-70 family RNA polymerase sigma factor [Terriglobia bacterium]|nr:sigma-70 family RNA polymerase sigma factor [Terriglobia bacterium]
MEVEDVVQGGVPTWSAPGLQPQRDHEMLGRQLTSYTAQLYRIAFRVLRSHEEAEDAVQDGLLSAIKNLKSFQGRSQFSTWLTRVVLNAALMRLRSVRARPVSSIDKEVAGESGLPLAAQIADPRADPEQMYAREEQLQMVKQTLAHLPASYRTALWLRDVEGMTTIEAAEALRVSEATLKSRLHRARVAVARSLHRAPRRRNRVS